MVVLPWVQVNAPTGVWPAGHTYVVTVRGSVTTKLTVGDAEFALMAQLQSPEVVWQPQKYDTWLAGRPVSA